MIKDIAKKYNQLIKENNVSQEVINQTLALLDGFAANEFDQILIEKDIKNKWLKILMDVEDYTKEQDYLDVFLDEGKVFSTSSSFVKKTNFNYINDTSRLFQISPLDEYYNLILLYFSSKNRAENLAIFCHMDK